MNPIVMRSLGDMVPCKPKADAGMMSGTAAAVPIMVDAWRKNRRREKTLVDFIITSRRSPDYNGGEPRASASPQRYITCCRKKFPAVATPKPRACLLCTECC